MDRKFSEFYYNKIKNEFDSSDHRKKLVSFIMDNYNNGNSMLEVGCGSGNILENFPMNFNYTGIDNSSFAIGKAIEKYGKSRFCVNFLVANSHNIPLKNESFDFVLSMYSLEHFLDPKKSLNEMVRVLKPGGHLIILAPNLEMPFSKPNAIRHKGRMFIFHLSLMRSLDYILRLIGVYKFRIVKDNYANEIGEYEKPDDDLTYFVSAFEVINFLKKKHKVNFIFKNRMLRGVGISNLIRKAMTYLPGMKYYGDVLFIICKK